MKSSVANALLPEAGSAIICTEGAMMIEGRRVRSLLLVIGLFAAAVGRTVAAAPPAPTPLAPAAGASVQVPFTISWSAATDPAGIVAYNWQVSSSSNFASVPLQSSTNGQTQDNVSGLAIGTYFWRVQAVNGAFEQGAWSAARSFTVTGVGPESPGTPSLEPTVGYSTFHPFEVIHFKWSAVPGAASYVLEAATDQNFPVATRILFDNIPETTFGFAIGNPEGNYWARVRAVSANGIAGVPSSLISFSVFFNNPLPAPPSPLSPPNGTTLTLPVTLTWSDVVNPQPSGYDLQIARNSSFSSIEESDPQLNDPSRTVLSLTPGTKFWRVHSVQGDASPTTAAVTAWSATGSFTISSAPARPVSVSLAKDPLAGGETTWVQIQLTAAVPAGGAAIALTSSNSAALPVPPTITMPGNTAWTQFEMNQFGMKAGQVTSPTPVTITATLNGASASGQFTVMPPSLKSLSISPSSISGGATAGGIVMLNGQAPAGGAPVSLSSNSPAVSPPLTVTVPPGSFSVPFAAATSNVTTNTLVTITASWDGVTVQSPITVTPAAVPTSLTLFPATAIGGGPGSVDGTVTIASAAAFDQFLQVTSNNPAVLPFLSSSVMVPAGSTRGLIQILPGAVSVTTVVTISVSAGGVTRSADLTVNPAGTPPPSATLSSFTVSPTSVTGGNAATGTVRLASAAPAGGTVVSLTSNLPGVASVPATVTVAAGAVSATFTVTTFPAATTTVQLSARLVDTILFAPLGVSPAPSPPASLQGVTLTPTSVTGGASSQGKVSLTSGAPQGGAVVALSSANTGVASVPASVTVPAGSTSATFTVTTMAVATSTSVIITASYNAVNKTAALTATAVPAPASLQGVTVTPTIVTGGANSQGKVTLSIGAPQGGAVVALSSGTPGVAGVPTSVTVPAGAMSATFAVTTTAVSAQTSVTIGAAYNGVTWMATLTVTPPAQTATLTMTATGRSGERITSSPAGINVAVGSSASAAFTTGGSVTLTVSNGRSATWSGACSSGGNRAKSCTFTLTGTASVTANVQ